MIIVSGDRVREFYTGELGTVDVVSPVAAMVVWDDGTRSLITHIERDVTWSRVPPEESE